MVIGQAKRKDVHGNPKLIHRSVGVAVFNKKGELFLQQRSATKDTDPLKWTISCSGHVEAQIHDTEYLISSSLADENFLAPQLATGFPVNHPSKKSVVSGSPNLFEQSSKCDLRKFHPAAQFYAKAAHRELYEELGVDLSIEPIAKFLARTEKESEMVVLFTAYSDGPFELNKEEIVQGKFFTRSKLKRLVKQGKIELSEIGRMSLEIIKWL